MAKDLFSKQASVYARYRPVYPAALFDYIFSFVRQRDTAWDCATGNGQAALVLADHFRKVYATDISEKQLQQAIAHPSIEYRIATAENSGLAAGSIDLITVAQAYHWFDFEAFHLEVMRVATPWGIIAIWGYSLVQCEDAGVQSLIETFYREKIGPYWDAERKYIDDHFTTVPFPYHELPARSFLIEVNWTREDLLGYFNTWSSVQYYMKAHQQDPVDEFARILRPVWDSATGKTFRFPVFLRLGKVHK